MPRAVYILFGAAFTAAVALALGRLLLRALGLHFRRLEEFVFAFTIGASLLSLLVFLLTAVGLARKAVFLAAGLLILATAGVGRLRKTPVREAEPPFDARWRYLFAAVIALFGFLYFVNALAPETSPDGSGYHLGLVARYLREHGFPRITTNMYANLSQGVEMLYMFAFAFGHHSAAALVHFTCLLMLPLAMLAYARRAGLGAAAAVTGALFTFASPVMGRDGTTAYNDVAVALILFTVFYLLQIWIEERRPALLTLAGLLAGFAYASKYTAIFALPYAMGLVAWKLRRARQPFLRPLLLLALCAFLMMAPWLAKNWLVLGNPFSPFLNQLFPNPYVHISFEREYAQYMRHYPGLRSYWEIPLEVTVRGQVLEGLIGPLFLLAPLGLLALRWPAGRQLLLAGAVFCLPYVANIGTRFLIPALPFWSLAMGMAASRLPAVAATLVLAHVIGALPPVMARYCDTYAWRLEAIPLRYALRLAPEEEYLRERIPSYLATRMTEDFTPKNAAILAFEQPPLAYTTRDIRVVYQSAANETLGDMLTTPLIAAARPGWRLTFRFPPRQARKLRVVQTQAAKPGIWSVSEFRVFAGGEEVRRRPQWQLRAQPNPWDVGMAFDDNLVTRWRSWQGLQAGMFIEVAFPTPLTADAVHLECSRDQYNIRLRLEGQDTSGVWTQLAAAPEESEAPASGDLRRLAGEAVKARGIGYLLITPNDSISEDLRTNASRWGVTLVGERNGTRLYKFE